LYDILSPPLNHPMFSFSYFFFDHMQGFIPN
jgi:hypothetical protein